MVAGRIDDRLYESRRRGSFDIFLMDPDGSDQRQLAHTVHVDEYETAWSPDGQRIALASIHDTSSWHVDLMRADGSGEHILVQQYSAYPAWSPDGSRIAFYACDADCALYRIKPNGRRFEPLGRHRGVADFDPDTATASRQGSRR
jgi:Tol biopolymer transport system component